MFDFVISNRIQPCTAIGNTLTTDILTQPTAHPFTWSYSYRSLRYKNVCKSLAAATEELRQRASTMMTMMMVMPETMTTIMMIRLAVDVDA